MIRTYGLQPPIRPPNHVQDNGRLQLLQPGGRRGETRTEQVVHVGGGEAQSQDAPLEVEVLWAGDGNSLQTDQVTAGRWNLRVPPPPPPPATVGSSTAAQSQGQMCRSLVPSPVPSRPQRVWRPIAQSPGPSSVWRPFQINLRPAQNLLRPWLPEQEEVVRGQTGIPKASVITINPVTTVPTTTVETWQSPQASLWSNHHSSNHSAWQFVVSTHHSSNHSGDMAVIPSESVVSNHHSPNQGRNSTDSTDTIDPTGSTDSTASLTPLTWPLSPARSPSSVTTAPPTARTRSWSPAVSPPPSTVTAQSSTLVTPQEGKLQVARWVKDLLGQDQHDSQSSQLRTVNKLTLKRTHRGHSIYGHMSRQLSDNYETREFPRGPNPLIFTTRKNPR